VAGNRNQRALQPPRHVFHEARFTAAGRTLEQHRKEILEGSLEQADFHAHGLVIRLIFNKVFFDLEEAGFGGLVGHIYRYVTGVVVEYFSMPIYHPSSKMD